MFLATHGAYHCCFVSHIVNLLLLLVFRCCLFLLTFLSSDVSMPQRLLFTLLLPAALLLSPIFLLPLPFSIASPAIPPPRRSVSPAPSARRATAYRWRRRRLVLLVSRSAVAAVRARRRPIPGGTLLAGPGASHHHHGRPSSWSAPRRRRGSGAECVRCVPPSHAQPACVASRGGEAQEGTAAKLGGRLPS